MTTIGAVPLSSPRSRPRAATATQPTTTPSSFSSRRPSQVMAPALSLGQNDPEIIGTASGPLRHPKPLTPSDLHSMLEQEQEAMVNRLSRELSTLRQQTASVASTTSSTSNTLNDSVDALHGPSHLISSSHPTASRRHRSSSSLSSSYVPVVQGSRTGSVTGITPSRDAYRPGDSVRSGRSREPSLTSPRPSEGLLSSSLSYQQQPHIDQPSAPFSHRNSLSSQRSRTTSISRPNEIAHHRGELESIKRENEALRQRVRDLELTVKRIREQESAPTVRPTNNTTSALTEGLRKASIAEGDDGK